MILLILTSKNNRQLTTLTKLIFATNNLNKLDEVQKMLSEHYLVLGLAGIGCNEDIPETADTLEGNAYIKSSYVNQHYQVNCFADDTGLEIEALNGEPGVISARYAGIDKDAEGNMKKVLEKLSDKTNRKARFRTVISLILDGQEYQFEGIVNGTILTEKQGEKGFGYDPIFKPDGYHNSFAELDMAVKNKISHRGLAVNKLIDFLNSKQ